MKTPFIDLAEVHGIVTKEFADVREAILSDQQLNKFHQEGFLTGVPLLDEIQLIRLREELDVLMEPGQERNALFYEYNSNESGDPAKRLFHALGAWRVAPAFHDLVFFRPLVSAAEQLLSGPVRFWHDQVFVKPSREGAVVAWHQDYSYWTRTAPRAHLTAWIGLDDSNEENGCVNYIPGSHRWPLLPKEQLAGGMESVLKYLSVEQRDDFRPFPSVLKAGEASFHHSMTLHGSFENKSNRPRRGVVINFVRDGVKSNTDEPLLSGVPPIPKGHKLDGKFFPLLSH